jgi:AAA+ ATPase superfamily predicted ATPase
VLLAAELEGRFDLKIREALRSGTSKAIAALSEILGKVKALEVSAFLIELLKLRVEFEEESLKGKVSEESLRKLVDSTLSFPSKSNSKFVIIFDEFQETATYKIGKPFHAVFRRITQYQKNVVYVYTGSSIGMMNDIFGNKKNPLAGNADIMSVVPFSEETSKKFLEAGFRSYGKKVNEESLQLFWEGTNGFPAYLNWAGIRCLDFPEKQIRRDRVSYVMGEMVSPISPVYQMVEKQLSKLGRISKLVLKAISQGYTTSSEIADNSPARNIYVYTNRLRKYGLITKSEQGYKIIDPVIMKIVLGY